MWSIALIECGQSQRDDLVKNRFVGDGFCGDLQAFYRIQHEPGQHPGIAGIFYFTAILPFFYYLVKYFLHLLVVSAYQVIDRFIVWRHFNTGVYDETTFSMFSFQ